MTKVNVIVERGKDGRYSAVMDYYELDFSLSGFGETTEESLQDLYHCYDEQKDYCSQEGKPCPELEFEIHYDISSFLEYDTKRNISPRNSTK